MKSQSSRLRIDQNSIEIDDIVSDLNDTPMPEATPQKKQPAFTSAAPMKTTKPATATAPSF